MFCKNCGTQVGDNESFCSKCGTKMEIPVTNTVPVNPSQSAMQQPIQGQPVQQPMMQQPIQGQPVQQPMMQQPVQGQPIQQPIMQQYQPMSPYPPMPKPKKKLSKNALIGILCGAGALFLALVGLVIFLVMPKKVDINKYITVEFIGYDGFGRAEIHLDKDKLQQDYGKKIKYSSAGKKNVEYLFYSTPLDSFVEYLDYDLDSSSGLSNGDEITLSWDNEDEIFKQCYNYGVKCSDMKFTVKGLKEAEKVDVFANVEVIFSGTSPEGYAEVTCKDKTDMMYCLEFETSQYNDLSNGDVITVTIDSYYSNDVASYCAENYGQYPQELQKEYTVSGLPEYMSTAADIDQSVISAMDQQAKDTIMADTTDWREGYTIDITNIGNYFLNSKQKDSWTHNMLYNVYKIHYTNTFLNAETNEDQVFEFDYYYYFKYENVIKAGDGTTDVDIYSYRDSDYYLRVDTGITESVSSWWGPDNYDLTFYGIETLDEIYQDNVVANMESFSYEDNIKQ